MANSIKTKKKELKNKISELSKDINAYERLKAKAKIGSSAYLYCDNKLKELLEEVLNCEHNLATLRGK